MMITGYGSDTDRTHIYKTSADGISSLTTFMLNFIAITFILVDTFDRSLRVGATASTLDDRSCWDTEELGLAFELADVNLQVARVGRVLG